MFTRRGAESARGAAGREPPCRAAAFREEGPDGRSHCPRVQELPATGAVCGGSSEEEGRGGGLSLSPGCVLSHVTGLTTVRPGGTPVPTESHRRGGPSFCTAHPGGMWIEG